MERIENTAQCVNAQGVLPAGASGKEEVLATAAKQFFSAADVFEAFGAAFLDNDRCREWLLRRIHGNAAACPVCGIILSGKAEERFWQYKRIRCPECRKFFNALTGSFLSGMHFSFSEFMLLAVFLEAGLSNTTIADALHCSPETVRMWRSVFSKNDSVQVKR